MGRIWKPALLWGTRLIATALLGAFFVYGFLQLGGSVIDSSHFHLRRIQYEGVHRLDRKSLDHLIRENVPESLWLMDLGNVRQLVESEKWVSSAVVRRQFPDTLRILVTERRPAAVAAIDDDLWVVDAEGNLLDSYGPEYADLDRPIVIGLKNSALEHAREDNRTRMLIYFQLLTEFNEADAAWSRQISEINVADPERVAVVPTAQAIPVYLGREHFAERYRTFLSQARLLERLRQQHGAIESVDVTFEDRIIIHTGGGRAQGEGQPRTS